MLYNMFKSLIPRNAKKHSWTVDSVPAPSYCWEWLVTIQTTSALYYSGEDWKYICKQIGKVISGGAKCYEENKEMMVWSTTTRRVSLLREWPGKVSWRRWLLSWGRKVVTTVNAGLLKGTSMTWLGIWKTPSALESREQDGHERRWPREVSKWDPCDSSNRSEDFGFPTPYHGNSLGRTWRETGERDCKHAIIPC